MASNETPSSAPAMADQSATASGSARTHDGNNRGRGRGGRGGKGRPGNKGSKMDGAAGSRERWGSKRDQVHETRTAKRRKVIDNKNNGNSYMSIDFAPEEIASEERRPKRKVAVLFGYSGTGYHGLQINHSQKTIEGDLFAAFVKAGAISKANADDPKKSSMVRCARTDKGVHAAGNVLSLKLIVEDEDIVEKINSYLPDQIRVWGIHRTPGSFSAYQGCDSRWYEYLMPSYSLLPPQPQSFLGKSIASSAIEKGVYEEYQSRIEDVKGFWEEVEKNDIKPILDALEPSVRVQVERVLLETVDQALEDDAQPSTEGATDKPAGPEVSEEKQAQEVAAESTASEAKSTQDTTAADSNSADAVMADAPPSDTAVEAATAKPTKVLTPVELAAKEIKAAYVAAKRRYRTTPTRIEKLQKALDLYIGTHNFHNYTILKAATDPSAKRHIKSFQADTTPIHIGDTEWISIKIHGQSFMMHQIRKMIAMAVMVVRSGAPLELITQSYEHRRISIPKAPGLGLMLERPVFAEASKKAVSCGRDPIDFAQYEDKIRAFKDEHIYKRMFEVEDKENSFHLFFNQVDNYRTDYFLWVTAGGVEASHERTNRTGERVPRALQAELGDEADGVQEIGT
ncbi:tRNA pseudouridine synthase 1 [Podospora aff. communis PSN243]|uniref:tRNA pseudouridine synthase 1 n=1 Tax=Podospora aff. communis PSN243 TaxID=3040156 RepID=A0AAV9GLX1_9PEZI|nr:tRNA pseudouridine synthase 1 [Podospora aff. communis PSN243]